MKQIMIVFPLERLKSANMIAPNFSGSDYTRYVIASSVFCAKSRLCWFKSVFIKNLLVNDNVAIFLTIMKQIS